MNIPSDQLIKILSQFNPWWRGEAIPDLAGWHRASFQELFTWVYTPPAPRAVFLSGARQVGKTTLLLQVVDKLLKEGVVPGNILYATFDHPIIKMAGIDRILEAWREREPKTQEVEYLLLDEAQSISNLGTWVKHKVDFDRNRRIVFTGSAMPLISSEQESGVGRWHTIRLTTLSFYEYLQLKKSSSSRHMKLLIDKFKDFDLNFDSSKYSTFFSSNVEKNLHADNIRNIDFLKDFPKYSTLLSNLDPVKFDFSKFLSSPFPEPPSLKSLRDLFEWPQQEFYRVAELAVLYVGHFHEYLVRGGFPQTTQVESITQAQRLLREDIIDKVLKRDMTALFGVRRVLDLEQTFLYLCMHDGGLLDMQGLCKNLEVTRPTAQRFIELLEASHLIYRLQPFGYGKEILRGKYKIYLADAAIAPAVLLKGKNILDNTSALGIATETAVFKHLFARYYPQDVRFSYWRGVKDHEVDLVAEMGSQIIPFEVKYRSQRTGMRDLKGLLELCKAKNIEHAYVITKSLDDFGLLNTENVSKTKIMRIPAPLLCYWMGECELSQIISLD